MSLLQKFKNLRFIEKLGIIGSIASLLGLALVFLPSPSSAPDQTITGDDAIQIGTVGGGVTITQSPRQINPADAARSQRVAAESLRAIARGRIPIQPPFPNDWIQADSYFNTAKLQFSQANYVDAASNYKTSSSMYSDIISRTNEQQ